MSLLYNLTIQDTLVEDSQVPLTALKNIESPCTRLCVHCACVSANRGHFEYNLYI